LYLTAQERERFLDAANHEDRQERMFCHVLHYTGCRPSEALELSPGRILMEDRNPVAKKAERRQQRAAEAPAISHCPCAV
jgi:integrase